MDGMNVAEVGDTVVDELACEDVVRNRAFDLNVQALFLEKFGLFTIGVVSCRNSFEAVSTHFVGTCLFDASDCVDQRAALRRIDYGLPV